MPDWSDEGRHPRLGTDDVHVWRFALDRLRSMATDLAGVLSEDELARAARHHDRAGRQRFVVARGLLRTLLGRYTGLEPSEICFVYNAWGKPSIDARNHAPVLRFNLSHSGDIALCAVTRGGRVGVDVELIRPGLEIDGIVQGHLSPHERAQLADVPPSLRTEAFFRCWTRKEAFAKACGGGLSLAFHGFSVSLTPRAAAVVDTPWDPDEAARWTLWELDPGAPYLATVAVEGGGNAPALWAWPDQGLTD